MYIIVFIIITLLPVILDFRSNTVNKAYCIHYFYQVTYLRTRCLLVTIPIQPI